MKKSESVTKSKSEFSKPKQITATECLALETVRFVLQTQIVVTGFCLTQLDVSSKDFGVDKSQNRLLPVKIIKIEGVLSQPFARQKQNARIVAHIHIQKDPKQKTALRLSLFAISTDGLGEKDAHTLWEVKNEDPLGSFSQQLLSGTRRPIARQKFTKLMQT